MNNKKIQAQMQIDVSFLSKGLSLTKDIQSQLDKVKFTGHLNKGFTDDLSKQFKTIESNYNKMINGLSKKGLSSKQYSKIFEESSLAIKKNIESIRDVGKAIKEAYNSKEQKDLLKGLEAQKQLLQDIKKLQSSMKQSNAAGARATGKLKDEFGLDFGNSEVRNALKAVKERRGAGKTSLTPTQRTVLGTDDETKIKRILTLYDQIITALDKVKIKQAEINGVGGVEGIEKRISIMEKEVITEEQRDQILKMMGAELDNLAPKEKAFNDELARGTSEAEKAAKASQSFKEVLAQFGIVFSAASLARGFKDLIKSSFDFYKSLDSALNEIYVVSNLTSKQVDGLKNNFINMAKETGMALDDVTRSAVLFYQQGLNTQEVMTMTEVTAQFAKVAGIDATDAADKLTAAVNGYCLSAENAAEVADKFNKVAAVSAADINELSTAFSKAAAQANQAGVSMDNYLAYIATMEEATREAPENLGTSLKTIFSRMQQIKTGENTEDNVDVNAVETALRSVGIQLRDTEGQLRDLEEIFDELGPKWNTLDRNTQAYLGTIIAGTRQQSRFITLMQNWDRVLELSEESANSAGQQALMHAKAMESIESKLNQLRVAWQEFVSNLTNSATFKNIIDLMKNFLNLLNGGTKPLMLLAGAVTLLGNKLKDLQTPLKNKGLDILGSFGIGRGQKAISYREKKAKLAQNSQNLQYAQDNLANIIDQHPGDVEGIKLAEEKLEIYKKQREQILGQVSGVEQLGKAFKVAGVAVQTLGLYLAQSDETLGGMVSSVGALAVGAGQIATGNWIGGAVSLVTAGIQFFSSLDKAAENAKKKMVDAVQKVKKEAQELSNQTTTVRNTGKLIDKYKELYNRTYRTKEEQQQLNNVIQQMSDSMDIETVTDEYGNLIINIDIVREKYKQMQKDQEDALAKMKQVEEEQLKQAQSGILNNNKEDDYIKEIVSQNSNSYRGLLIGIEDGLDSSMREIGKSTYESFNIGFKDAIQDTVSKNEKFFFKGEGIAQSFVNLERGINDALLGSEDGWNYVYKQIDYFQKNIDDLSWEDFSQKFNSAFEDWREQIGLTTDQWMVLKEAIQTTIYGSKEYVEYMNKFDTQNGRIKDYENLLKEQKEELDEYFNDVYLVRWNANGSGYQKTLGSGSDTMLHYYSDVYNHDLDPRNTPWEERGTDDYNILIKGKETYEKYMELHKTNQPFAIQSDEMIDDEEAQKVLDRYQAIIDKKKELEKELGKGGMKLFEATSQLKGNADTYVRGVGSLFDESGFAYEEGDSEETKKAKDDAKQKFREMAAEVALSAKDWDNASDIGLAMMKEIDEQIEKAKQLPEGTLKDVTLDNLKKAKKEIENDMPSVKSFSWGGILDTLENYSDDLQTVNGALEELNKNGAISTDTFKGLANVMDSLNLGEIFESFDNTEEGLDYIHGLTEAMKNLNVQYDANTGMLKMNAESVEYLQDAQERQAKGKIKSMINDLYATKASVESQIAYIDAQIAAMENVQNTLANMGDEKINVDKLMEGADKEYGEKLAEYMGKVDSNYEKLTESSLEWAKESIYQISEVTNAWNQYWQAVRSGAANAGELRKTAENLTKNFTTSQVFENAGVNLDDYDGVSASSKKGEELKKIVSDRINGLRATREEYAKTLGLYEGQIAMLESMYNSDLGKLGSKDGDNNKLQKYIGQLKEIYNILNRIQMLEHRLGTLDTYSDIAQGKEYGSLLQQRLNYNEELLDQYAFLVSEQKQFTNGYKDFIQSVDGLEGVFGFDQFGQIIINWEKYNSLQDEAIEGEISLKEKADDVYNTYTSMMGELQGYFDKYISYLKNTLNLLNEMRSNYVDLEKQAAAAVQEIYKKELDAKLDAIDKEMKALEELTQARQKANKERDNAKALSGYQADLQRAMMDTSGASDANYIKAQQNISDKLDAMAEDKYSEMINDIKKQLEEEKDVLQKNFDELFENQEWLYAFLDTSVMSDFDAVKDILTQTEAWAKESPTNRWEEIRNWDKLFNSYAQDGIYGTKGINGVLDKIVETEGQIAELDRMLKNENSKGDANIIQTIERWGQKVADAAASGHYSNSPSGGSPYSPGGGGDNNNRTWIKTDYYEGYINKDAEKGTFSTKDKNGVEYQPNNYNGSYLKSTGAKAGQAGIKKNSGNDDISGQNIWVSQKGEFLIWNGRANQYEPINSLLGKNGNVTYFDTGLACTQNIADWLKAKNYKTKYAHGGFANFTGPAWMDGTSSAPEAVLDALQTKHFIDFTNTLDKMYSNVGQAGVSNASSVTIDNISFNVESMSSPEDGEKAFNAFVDKFKEIGDRTGLKVQTFKNTL